MYGARGRRDVDGHVDDGVEGRFEISNAILGCGNVEENLSGSPVTETLAGSIVQ